MYLSEVRVKWENVMRSHERISRGNQAERSYCALNVLRAAKLVTSVLPVRKLIYHVRKKVFKCLSMVRESKSIFIRNICWHLLRYFVGKSRNKSGRFTKTTIPNIGVVFTRKAENGINNLYWPASFSDTFSESNSEYMVLRKLRGKSIFTLATVAKNYKALHCLNTLKN